MSKRLLIITNYFEKEYRYQEVQIAETLYQMGYDVTVISSNRGQFDKKKRLNEDCCEYKIIRLKKIIRISTTLYPIGNFYKLIAQINPEIVFLIHPSWGLPYFVSRFIPTQCKVVSIFGDLYDNFSLSIKGKLSRRFIKNRWDRNCFQRSDLIIANTNETVAIFKSYKFYKNNIEKKLIRCSLGYDSNLFFFDSEVRNKYREKYNISSKNIVLITITRIVSYKPILEWIKPIMRAMKKNKDLIYIIGGFSDSNYSRTVKDKVLSSDVADQFILLNLLESSEMNALFNCADFGVWFGATSSIQQSMGTGLPTIIPKNRTLDHLVEPEVNGMYYDTEEDLYKKLISLDKNYDKRSIYEYNKKFSYKSILEKIINNVDGKR